MKYIVEFATGSATETIDNAENIGIAEGFLWVFGQAGTVLALYPAETIKSAIHQEGETK